MKTRELQHIVIVRFSSIGDIVLTTPVVRILRNRFPEARIDFVLKQEFAELMTTNPHLSTVYPYDSRSGFRGLQTLARRLRENRYDLLVDLHNNFRSRLLRIMTRPGHIVTFSKQFVKRTVLVKTGINLYRSILQVPDRYIASLHEFGLEPDGSGLDLFPTDAHQAKVTTLFQKQQLAAGDLTIGFAPISAHSLKQWPIARFIELGQELVRRYKAGILLIGGPDDLPRVQQIAEQLPNSPIMACGHLSLMETAAAIRRCALFVGNDTGMAHIAAAMQRKIIVVFGPTTEEFGFYPYHAQARVISKSLPCRPCTHTGKNKCKLKTHACMQEITAADVLEAVEALLDT